MKGSMGMDDYKSKKGNDMKRYYKLSNILSESELLILEDALRKYASEKKRSENDRQDLFFDQLLSDIVSARRWAHQFGKSQH